MKGTQECGGGIKVGGLLSWALRESSRSSAFHPLGRACKLLPHGPPPCFVEPLLTAQSIGKSVLKEGVVPEQKLRQVAPCGPSGVSVREVWSSIPPGTVSSPKVAFPQCCSLCWLALCVPTPKTAGGFLIKSPEGKQSPWNI